MEPTGSLSCSQKLNICTYHEPQKLVHAIPPYVFNIYFNNIIPPMPSVSSGFFPSGSPTRCMNSFFLFCMQAICPAHLILLNLNIITLCGEE